MGFFSEIASEARRNTRAAALSQPAVAEQRVLSREAPLAPKPEPAPPAPELAPIPEQQEQPSEPSAHTPPPPEVKLAVGDAAPAPDDDAKRKAHEAAEAKRKAEFDAKQAEKKAARQAALDRIAAMNGAELLAAAAERVAADTERLTRRNMKEAVAEHIQAKCREDAAFAMLVMDPEKSMTHCFWYINRKAKEFIEKEIKDADPNPASGMYGGDVPDDMVYQMAEAYFCDENAEEDHKDDEKFVPKPYVPTSTNRKKAQGKADKKPAPAAKPKAAKPTDTGMEQISLM